MNFEVYYKTRWIRNDKFCGEFKSLYAASQYVDYLQDKLPGGRKITFKIVG